jgi:hypothetical protein
LHYSYKNIWKILEIIVLYLNNINPKLFIGELVLLLHGPSESKEVPKGVKELRERPMLPTWKTLNQK